MTTYLVDDGNCELEIEAETAMQAAKEYVDDGNYGHPAKTARHHIRTKLVGTEDDWEWHVIEVHPDEPDCVDGPGHEWDEDRVVGNGGGVVIVNHCTVCGLRKTIDTWAQDPFDGTQGHRTVSYENGSQNG